MRLELRWPWNHLLSSTPDREQGYGTGNNLFNEEDQIAMLITSSRKKLCGCTVISIDEFMKQIKADVGDQGIMAKNAIPEEFDLLRTVQMAVNGYYKLV